ncbi:MAG: hypothetical protein COS85_10190 [Armatimonadetes bacterium CG07_land_8_20_14_0_80_59_28]|nr:MAG: hypothetical protein COS85_10190 [Armatimonadetes bacterium CG07_land_8_20_14_0_80_59_28]
MEPAFIHRRLAFPEESYCPVEPGFRFRCQCNRSNRASQQQPQLFLGGCSFSPWQRVEQFLRGMGILPMNSSSRPEVSGLEQPWKLTPE